MILVGNLNQAYLSNHQLFQSQKKICPTKDIFKTSNDGTSTTMHSKLYAVKMNSMNFFKDRYIRFCEPEEEELNTVFPALV